MSELPPIFELPRLIDLAKKVKKQLNQHPDDELAVHNAGRMLHQAAEAGGLVEQHGDKYIKATIKSILWPRKSPKVSGAELLGPRLAQLGIPAPTTTEAEAALVKILADQDAKELARNITAREQGADVFELIPITEFMLRPNIEWTIKDVMQRCGVGQLISPPGKHKTGLALDMGLSISQGLDEWMGFEIERHGPVLYLFLEGVFGAPGRIRAWQAGHGLDGVPDNFIVSESPINLGASVSLDAMSKTLSEMDETPAVIFIDTQARATRGVKENDAEEMGKIMEACSKIAKEFDTYVLLVHHTGHDTSRGRGSSDQAASVDLWIQVDEDLKFTLKKVKEAEPGAVRYFEAVEEADSIYVRRVDAVVGAARADIAQRQKVLTYYRDNPGKTKTVAAKAIKGTYETNRSTIDSLITEGALNKSGTKIYVATDEAAA